MRWFVWLRTHHLLVDRVFVLVGMLPLDFPGLWLTSGGGSFIVVCNGGHVSTKHSGQILAGMGSPQWKGTRQTSDRRLTNPRAPRRSHNGLPLA